MVRSYSSFWSIRSSGVPGVQNIEFIEFIGFISVNFSVVKFMECVFAAQEKIMLSLYLLILPYELH